MLFFCAQRQEEKICSVNKTAENMSEDILRVHLAPRITELSGMMNTLAVPSASLNNSEVNEKCKSTYHMNKMSFLLELRRNHIAVGSIIVMIIIQNLHRRTNK